ncbi:Ni2+-binding GTPase involved in maturation of urease and hydrogenase [Natranaerovirga hydrolytica]|uniref:Ni2+-binding GTPase involved in maturation of urease and hydrogenase n=1 Tax=Natranaerovirga hydrolytica TaxID=680378 RepID=A0A4R1MKR3_9FIRM|nr:GTP-binding protein [Natranaerovirga hydrolytica]TCK93326.1 Ni2+-binding GTPase involved in maturation of urease and hydrogenase [Natranaerovirga hydrolytica]
MNLITVSGPPSSGKTAVILKTIKALEEKNYKVGVAKFDCLSTEDGDLYKKNGIPVRVGISGNLCPDHYFISNIEECVAWGCDNELDFLISESAGLCNRCSPHIKKITAICVIDNLMGCNTPKKIGPMLKMADIIVVTKGDIVSQAEREVFTFKIRQANPKAIIMNVNGITGQGATELSTLLMDNKNSINNLEGERLRFSMPAALCSYCLGETQIGKDYQMGNIRKMAFDI